MRDPPLGSIISKPLAAALGMLPCPFDKYRHEAFKHWADLAGQIVAILVRSRLIHIRGLAQLQLHDVDIILGPTILPSYIAALEPLIECRRVAVGRRQNVHEAAGKMRTGA